MKQKQFGVPDSGEAPMMTSTARAQQPTRLSPRSRNLLLTVHIVVSVGVIGAELSMITLGMTGLNSRNPELIRASYLVMQLLVNTILLPLAFTALFTGILLGLGTRWGLAQYYWVLTKLLLTITVVTALVFVLQPRVNQAAAEVLMISPKTLITDGTSQIGLGVTLAIAVALLVLLTNATLAVNKPWGRIGLRRP
jgi:hypothetical protein